MQEGVVLLGQVLRTKLGREPGKVLEGRKECRSRGPGRRCSARRIARGGVRKPQMLPHKVGQNASTSAGC